MSWNAESLTRHLLVCGVAHQRIDRGGALFIQVGDTDCVLWTGPRTQVRWINRSYQVARLVWQLVNGAEPPAGKTTWWRCGTYDCCNPDHIEWITDRQRGRRERHTFSDEIYALAPVIACSHCGGTEGSMSIQDSGGGRPLWQFRCATCARAYDSASYRRSGEKRFHGRTKLLITDEEIIDMIRADRCGR